MARRISQRDLEAISAYLDGQLNARERTRLEARLQADSALHQALEEIRRTRAMLRSLPKLRAPRNYVLTPQMVARKPAPAAYPVLRFASALATILLALVLVGDFLTPRVAGLPALAPTPTEEIVMMQEAAPAAEEPPAEGAGQAGDNELRAFEALPESPQPTLTAPVEPTPEPVIAAQPDAAEESGERATSQPGFLNNTSFRILEVFLALVALVTGVAALYLRRASGAR